ncbi:MAG: endonuclease III [Bacteroidota bacterium]
MKQPEPKRKELPAKDALKILKILNKQYKEYTVALDYQNPLELMVSTILSAQCTDERVNKVTPALFKKYHTAKEYANANIDELEELIRSTGFYHAKARSIVGACKGLVERYNGIVPDTMEDLITLPGVGRKTANVILSFAYQKVEGIIVDTHVSRVSGRLGFTKQVTADKIELDLMQKFPKKEWIAIGDSLIWHGRKICNAAKPKCGECMVKDLCPSAGYFMKVGEKKNERKKK